MGNKNSSTYFVYAKLPVSYFEKCRVVEWDNLLRFEMEDDCKDCKDVKRIAEVWMGIVDFMHLGPGWMIPAVSDTGEFHFKWELWCMTSLTHSLLS